MKYRKPFFAIPKYIFREILTYVDLQECHDLKMRKIFDQEEKARWWEGLLIPDWLWEREEMQRAFIEIYTVKYRAPFSRIPTSAFREILTYCQLEKLVSLMSAKNTEIYCVEDKFFEVSLRYLNQGDFEIGIIYMLIALKHAQ